MSIESLMDTDGYIWQKFIQDLALIVNNAVVVFEVWLLVIFHLFIVSVSSSCTKALSHFSFLEKSIHHVLLQAQQFLELKSVLYVFCVCFQIETIF